MIRRMIPEKMVLASPKPGMDIRNTNIHYTLYTCTLVRINLYLGFKDSMKLMIDDKDVKSRLSLFYNFIGISLKICIRYKLKVLISLSP